MSDHDLRTAVERELDWDPSINATGIGVAVNDGVVTLSGHVASYAEKREAERIADGFAEFGLSQVNLTCAFPN
jgi:osmotically-inducible protein OsmY